MNDTEKLAALLAEIRELAEHEEALEEALREASKRETGREYQKSIGAANGRRDNAAKFRHLLAIGEKP